MQDHLSLREVVKLLNPRLNHEFSVIFKNGDVIHLRGYELKQMLLTGKITLSQLRDIEDETYLKSFRPLKMPPLKLKLIKHDSMLSPMPRHDSSSSASSSSTIPKSIILKFFTGLVILATIMKIIKR